MQGPDAPISQLTISSAIRWRTSCGGLRPTQPGLRPKDVCAVGGFRTKAVSTAPVSKLTSTPAPFSMDLTTAPFKMVFQNPSGWMLIGGRLKEKSKGGVSSQWLTNFSTQLLSFAFLEVFFGQQAWVWLSTFREPGGTFYRSHLESSVCFSFSPLKVNCSFQLLACFACPSLVLTPSGLSSMSKSLRECARCHDFPARANILRRAMLALCAELRSKIVFPSCIPTKHQCFFAFCHRSISRSQRNLPNAGICCCRTSCAR